jgi:hypothetical protein
MLSRLPDGQTSSIAKERDAVLIAVERATLLEKGHAIFPVAGSQDAGLQ